MVMMAKTRAFEGCVDVTRAVTATEEEAWKEPTRARTKKDTSEKMTK